jgi:hypothetical protein
MRPERDPYPTEAARQRAGTWRLIWLAAALGGVVLGLLLNRFWL